MKDSRAGNKPSLVIALVEDSRTKMLLRQYLLLAGIESHQITIEPQRKWMGSGEQAVRLNYAGQVQAFRARSAGKKSETALIVAIDADTETVHHRLAQLAGALKESGQTPVDTLTERIAHLIPKKNVETWILCLNGESVTEGENYKNQKNYTDSVWVEKTRFAASALLEWTRSPSDLPVHCVLSLQSGIVELKRLNF